MSQRPRELKFSLTISWKSVSKRFRCFSKGHYNQLIHKNMINTCNNQKCLASAIMLRFFLVFVTFKPSIFKFLYYWIEVPGGLNSNRSGLFILWGETTDQWYSMKMPLLCVIKNRNNVSVNVPFYWTSLYLTQKIGWR